MYGLPARGLTYDEYVSLMLNIHRAQVRQAKAIVYANQISDGQTGPREYYLLDQSDEKEGDRAFEEARCRSALIRSTKTIR